MARLYRRPDLCRRHPRPARSQRPPHRSRRRQLEAQAAQINPKGLTDDTQLAKNLSLAEARQPGDIISYRRATSSRNQRATSSESAKVGHAPTGSPQGLFGDNQPCRHDRPRRGADAQLTDDAKQHVGLLPAKAGSCDCEIDSTARGVFGCFLDIRTNPDEVDCPALGDNQ
jgi:hypothetical protein